VFVLCTCSSSVVVELATKGSCKAAGTVLCLLLGLLILNCRLGWFWRETGSKFKSSTLYGVFDMKLLVSHALYFF
jgi:hypothetical protein